MEVSNQTFTKYKKTQRGQAEGLAWVYEDKESLKPTLTGYKHPELQENEVRVKISYFGVSKKDVQLLKSKDINVLVPGHEVVGVIEAVGQKVGMRKAGDIVGVGFIKDSCKNCRLCWAGKEELCKNVKNPLTVFPDLGGFGTHIQVPADWTFPIPKNIPLEEAAPLFFAGSTAFNAVSKQYERLKLIHKRKLNLCVLGLGQVGHLVVKFANYFGFEITVFSENPQNQNVLKENGINVESYLPLTVEEAKKNALKFDVAVIAGDISKQIAKLSITLVKRNGKLVILSQSVSEIGISGASLVCVGGVRNGSKDDFYKMLEIVAHSTTETNKTLLPICEHFTFLDIETAFEKAKTSTARFQSVVKVDDDILEKFNKKQI